MATLSGDSLEKLHFKKSEKVFSLATPLVFTNFSAAKYKEAVIIQIKKTDRNNLLLPNQTFLNCRSHQFSILSEHIASIEAVGITC